jgi:hypothetical protein
MTRAARWICASVALSLAASPAGRQATFNAHDDYGEYQLLDPASHQFRVVIWLTERAAGVRTLRHHPAAGLEAADVVVSDPQTGQRLKFELKTESIEVFLARPVPEGGEGRVRIEATYLDAKSYFLDNDDVVFERAFDRGRNAIVLPSGFTLVSSNVSAQVAALADGRVKIAFENVNGYAAPVSVRARKTGAPVASSLRVVERGLDFAKTLYDLHAPETHRVAVRHEYVETAPGSRSALTFLTRHVLTELQVVDMDLGRALDVVTEPRGRVAVLATPIANTSQSAHLRISGMEQDSAYRSEGGQLYWEKTLYEPRTTILLPAGWDVMAISTPATISATSDGRVAVQVYNPRVEPAAISLRANRRPSGGVE